MIDILKVKSGDKVHYYPDHFELKDIENGIVKSFGRNEGFIFVVYNCNNDWKNYQNYTAASTNVRDLCMGWRHKYINLP